MTSLGHTMVLFSEPRGGLWMSVPTIFAHFTTQPLWGCGHADGFQLMALELQREARDPSLPIGREHRDGPGQPFILRGAWLLYFGEGMKGFQ